MSFPLLVSGLGVSAGGQVQRHLPIGADSIAVDFFAVANSL